MITKPVYSPVLVCFMAIVLHFKLRQNWSSLDCFDEEDAVFHPDDQPAYHQEEDQHGQGPL